MAMHNQTEWQDRVTEYEDRYRETENPDGSFTHTPVEGEVLQEGTPQNQANFNNIENGIQDVTLAAAIYGVGFLLLRRQTETHEAMMDAETLGELQEITLTNNQTIPFNSTMDSPRSVALNQSRKNLFYSVEAEVLEHTGEVGEIIISAKALNGFKIAFSGSGTSVKLAVRIKGGMT